MHGEWILKPKSFDTAVVFVHGILSSAKESWRHNNGTYWPNLLKKDFDELGIYVFTYSTDIFSGNYSLDDVVDALKECLSVDKILNCQRIVFVCHSMGGIVVRQYLVTRQSDLIDKNIEIGLFLVASPSLGSEYANWLSPVAKILGNIQVDALRFSQNNTWLNGLDKHFINLKGAEKLHLKGKELVEDKFYFKSFLGFLRKPVVPPFSGARYFGDAFKVPKSDHGSIAKPKNKKAIQHRILCQFIENMLSIQQETDVEKESPQSPARKRVSLRIVSDKGKRARTSEAAPREEKEALGNAAIELVKALNPNASPTEVLVDAKRWVLRAGEEARVRGEQRLRK